MSTQSEKEYWWLNYRGSVNECSLCRTELKTVTPSALEHHSITNKHKINLQKYKQSSSIQSSKMSQTNSQNSEWTKHNDANFQQLETSERVRDVKQIVRMVHQKPDQNLSLKRSRDSDQDLNVEKKYLKERLLYPKYIYDVYSSSEIIEIPIKLDVLGEKFLNILNKEMTLKFCQMLNEDVVEKPFSLFLEINETKDNINRMCIIIRYYSHKFKKFICLFLNNVKLDVGTLQKKTIQIRNAIEETAKEFKLQLKYLIGIGVHTSSQEQKLHYEEVFQHLKMYYEIVSFYPILCTSSSLQKASLKALTDSLYRNKQNVIRDTYNWFNKYKHEFDNLYVFLNVKEILKYHRQFDDVSWFFIPKAVSNILTKWEDLKTHFEKTKEQHPIANKLYKIYENKEGDKNKFIFLNEYLEDVTRANEEFECLEPDAVKMLNTFNKLRDNISLSKEHSKKHLQKSKITEEQKKKILKKREDFINSFIENMNYLNLNSENSDNGVFKSYPDIRNNFKNLSLKNSDAKSIVALVESRDEIKKGKIISEWNKLQLNLSKLSDTSKLQKSWEEIFNQKDSSGDYLYPEISLLAMKHLSLPLSDSNVKCIFRQINCIGKKATEDKKLTTFNDILRIKHYLKYMNECTGEDLEGFLEIIINEYTNNFTPTDFTSYPYQM